MCGDTDKELQIHHRDYGRGAEPWETASENLVSLCRSCHEEVTALKKSVAANLHYVEYWEAIRITHEMMGLDSDFVNLLKFIEKFTLKRNKNQ